MNEIEILKDYDEKKLKVDEIISKYGIKKHEFFALIKRERPFERRIQRRRSDYHLELEKVAQNYWKKNGNPHPPEKGLAWILIPTFGEEFTGEFLKVRAYIKKNKDLLKLLEEGD